MYELVGKLLIYGLWISVILIVLSLFFGYIALKRKIVLYSFFASILDFFYLPIITIYAYFGNMTKLDAIIVELKNKANKKRYEKSKKRLFLVPHCLRSLDCPAQSTVLGIKCKSCGRCPYAEMKKTAESLDMKFYIITGSSIVKYIIRKEKFDGVLLLACNHELNKIMRMLAPHNVSVYGVPLTKDGCYNTKTDLKALYGAMKRIGQ